MVIRLFTEAGLDGGSLVSVDSAAGALVPGLAYRSVVWMRIELDGVFGFFRMLTKAAKSVAATGFVMSLRT